MNRLLPSCAFTLDRVRSVARRLSVADFSRLYGSLQPEQQDLLRAASSRPVERAPISRPVERAPVATARPVQEPSRAGSTQASNEPSFAIFTRLDRDDSGYVGCSEVQRALKVSGSDALEVDRALRQFGNMLHIHECASA